ncbi:DUF4232 domain-containing protein [Actinomadura xylanilytica]|uniref:DUF4232 domain-containing protein n=1 Tax=Actinomadura xylanilytica TaxID=887459 RepID=UPI00255B16D9|nr:DUF4232 domain-containing protein [Actinomadura xylanilytica]MDL4775375.1 DUF4232 domain-containing protein [Actinomadura xylanilytica]
MLEHTQTPPAPSFFAPRLHGTARGRWRSGVTLAACTVLAFGASACNDDSAGGAGGTTGGTASASTSSPHSAPHSASAGGAGGGGAASSRCTSVQLGIHLGMSDVGAGNLRYELRLTNKGSHSCTLQGYPGVSLLRGDGSTIGRPATHEGPAGGLVRIAPGGGAHVTLHTLNKGVKGDGCWEEPGLLKVYPPGSKAAMTLRTTSPHVCGDTFTVTSVQGT